MKKFIVFALVMVMVLGVASLAFAKVGTSKHDLTTTGTASFTLTNTDQICAFCHHPHRGETVVGDDTNASNELLWNMGSITEGNTAYSSASMTATAANLDSTAAPQSLLCMACHDGFIGINALIRSTTAGDIQATQALTTSASLGDLANDHPVNMLYDDTNDTGLAAPDGTSPNFVGGGVYPLYTGDTMQCATCHDVHAGTDTVDTNGTQFLRGDTAGSAICMVCHDNK